MTSNPMVSGSAAVRDTIKTANDVLSANDIVFGSATRVAVERAVAELRAGRPVRLSRGGDVRLLFAAETALSMWDEIKSVVTSDIRLVLPMERLDYLHVRARGPRTCAGRTLSHAEAEELVFAQEVRHVPLLREADPIEAAAIDLTKFSHLVPAALVCKMPAALEEPLHAITVDEIHGFHHETAQDLKRVSETSIPLLDDADAKFVVFRGSDGLKDQVAIVVGAPDPDQPVPLRMHSACLTGDLFGSLKCDCGEQLRRAVKALKIAGGGILLYLDQEGRGIGLGNKIRAYALQENGFDTVDADAALGYGPDERRYGIAARMVSQLGFRTVSLLTNNPQKVAALQAQGIEVADRVSIVGSVNPHNQKYLRAKSERSGHLMDISDG